MSPGYGLIMVRPAAEVPHPHDDTPFGSWTLKDASLRRGAEPDECYVLGGTSKGVPDLVLEVVWTSGAFHKVALYGA